MNGAPDKDGEKLGEAPSQTPLYFAIERARYTRQQLIRQIQNETGAWLLCYVSGGASITTRDIPPMVDLLQTVPKGADIDLLLHTGGGDVDQAERLVKLLRAKADSGRFRVIVPNSAKSAGTLIAVAADVIVMSDQSELGPIDPQILITNASGVRAFRPAQSILDGLAFIAGQGNPTLPQAYFPLLQQLDPALVDFCRKALQRSEKFATDFLSLHMLKDSPAKAVEVAKKLNDAKAHLSHGAVIDARAAADMGLKIDYRSPDDREWRAIWSLYLQLDLALTSAPAAQRIFEGATASIIAS